VNDVLDFWFGGPQERWFTKSDATDAEIRTRFGGTIEAALRGELKEWTETPRGTLASIIVLDQFTRNVFRDTPAMFAGDARARDIARALVASGEDQKLAASERWFAYMPFEHSELMADQHESMRLFSALAEQTGLTEPLEWARKHFDVVARFGRYPHRNALLGRESTAEEIEFLAQPGSRF